MPVNYEVETSGNENAVVYFDVPYQYFFFPLGASPYGDSRSHADTRQSVGLLWTSDQPVAETST
jgi:hypothetical protein